MSLDSIFSKLKQLPTMPILLHQLMHDFADENAKIEDISKKIVMDQSISARVLKMANSVVYSRGIPVTSIEQAIIRLGFKQVSSLVVATSLNNSFKTPKSFDKNKFWIDTFQVSSIAKVLAKDNLAIKSGQNRIDAQRETIGYDYSQVGAELVRRWKLPDFFVASTSQHLDPLGYDEVNPGAVIIRLALFVNFAITAGVPPAVIIKRFPTNLIDAIDLDEDNLADRINELKGQSNELANILLS